MIYAAVHHIAQQLNQYLKNTFDLSEDIAVLSNIVEQDGSLAANAANKMVVCLVSIEKDATPGHLPGRTPSGGRMAEVSYPPIHTNLYVLFAGNFNGKNYGESLKFLSYTIGFFQRNPLFTRQNSPELDPRIAKLSLDIENLNMKDLSSLWSVLSGKYLPSVLYKIRMVSFDAHAIASRVPGVTEPRTTTEP